MTTASSSDAAGSVSAGCVGSALVATAVRITLPKDAGTVGYTVSQVQILGQASATAASKLVLTLYSDDGGAQPAPRAVVGSATSISVSQKAIATTAAYQWSVLTLSAWPVLTPGASYWISLAPGAAVTQGDGAIWAGFDSTSGISPAPVTNDAQLFTARQLTVPGGCSNATALSLIKGTPSWARQGANYRNWQAQGSVWRYGVSVIGTPLY